MLALTNGFHLSNSASALVGNEMEFYCVLEKVLVTGFGFWGFWVLFVGFGKKMVCVHESRRTGWTPLMASDFCRRLKCFVVFI